MFQYICTLSLKTRTIAEKCRRTRKERGGGININKKEELRENFKHYKHWGPL